jgi:hypothetical protein
MIRKIRNDREKQKREERRGKREESEKTVGRKRHYSLNTAV